MRPDPEQGATGMGKQRVKYEGGLDLQGMGCNELHAMKAIL
jgi:hypothetical protein